MLQVGAQCIVDITGISHQGMGIGRFEQMVVFVPQALLQEKVLVEITEVKKNLANGRLIEVIEPSTQRQEALCQYSQLCGGCELQHSSYDYQLMAKRQIVQDAMTKLARVDIEVLPVIGMEDPWRYRNKGVFHVDYQNGQVRLGFYQQGSHDFVMADHCHLFSQAINDLVQYLQQVIYQNGKANYIQKIMLRESRVNQDIMVVFITKDQGWRLPQMVDQLLIDQPKVVSVYHNVNTNPKLMLGRSFQLLKGQATIIDTVGQLQFQISPQSFFQVNNEQAYKLYHQALEYADLKGDEQVIDAYCGIGTISLFLAQKAKMVYGVESVGQAIKDANTNATLNDIPNCKFITAKTEEWLPKWVAKGNKADVIIVDPPRKGCESPVLDAIINSKTPKVVYVSCNPSTLARDIRYLTENGYAVQAVQPVDLFSQSWHCEVVIQMKYCNK